MEYQTSKIRALLQEEESKDLSDQIYLCRKDQEQIDLRFMLKLRRNWINSINFEKGRNFELIKFLNPSHVQAIETSTQTVNKLLDGISANFQARDELTERYTQREEGDENSNIELEDFANRSIFERNLVEFAADQIAQDLQQIQVQNSERAKFIKLAKEADYTSQASDIQREIETFD